MDVPRAPHQEEDCVGDVQAWQVHNLGIQKSGKGHEKLLVSALKPKPEQYANLYLERKIIAQTNLSKKK